MWRSTDDNTITAARTHVTVTATRCSGTTRPVRKTSIFVQFVSRSFNNDHSRREYSRLGLAESRKKKNGFKFNFDSETLLTKQYLLRLIVAFDLRKQRFYSFVLRNVREKKSKKSFFDATRLRGSLVLWWNQSIFLQSNAEDTTTACKRRCKFTRSFRRRILFGGDLRVCVFYFLLLKTIDEFERKLKITARRTHLCCSTIHERATHYYEFILHSFYSEHVCGAGLLRCDTQSNTLKIFYACFPVDECFEVGRALAIF